jgi:Transposase IS66 family
MFVKPFVGPGQNHYSTACKVGWKATLAKLSRKSDTAAAIRYASSRWKALTRYVDDSQLEIDGCSSIA